MPIDTSMYGNLQAPDFAGAIDRGMRLADLAKQRRESADLKEAYKAGVVQNPDGTTTVDRAKTMSALAGKGYAKEAMQFDRESAADQQAKIESKFKQANMISQLLGGVKDQASWDSALQTAKGYGLDVSQVPAVYDPVLKERLEGQALTFQDRIAQQNKERELRIREVEASRKAVGDPLAEELKHERLAKMQREKSEAAFKATPEGRIQGLNSGDKQRLDNAKLGLTAVQGMADALLKGNQNTFSLIGDNDFTQQRSLFEEALGRMQSGGAISKEEEMRFKGMAPKATDNLEMQRKKLKFLQSEMSSRLGTLGFQPADVGLSIYNMDSMKSKPADSAAGIQKANAASSQVFKTKDIDWAD